MESTAVQNKLQEIINRGRANAQTALARLEADLPDDRLVARPDLRFVSTGTHVVMRGKEDNDAWTIHQHALGQIAAKLGIPSKYARQLSESPWGRSLLAHNFNQLREFNTEADAYFVRSVHGEARGFLSDRYRPMDSGLIMQAFTDAAQQYSCAFTGAHVMDTRWAVKVLVPRVYEPVAGEHVAMGLQISHSDYGDGALSMKAFLLRLVCANGMTRDEALRQIHLGRRLEAGVFSRETYRKDAEAIASAVRDVVTHRLNPASVDAEMAAIREAAETAVDPSEKMDALRNASKLTKAETEQLRDVYTSADHSELPQQGNTVWRMSNAISRLAGLVGDDGNDRRQIELEALAGEVLPKVQN